MPPIPNDEGSIHQWIFETNPFPLRYRYSQLIAFILSFACVEFILLYVLYFIIMVIYCNFVVLNGLTIPDSRERLSINGYKIWVQCLFLILVSGHLCSAQNANLNIHAKQLPSDFPIVPAEGASQSELDAYKLAKEVWMRLNPEQYRILSEVPSLYSDKEQRAIRAKKESEVFRKDTLPTQGGGKP